MHERCNTCTRPLVWSGQRLVCPGAQCPGHDLNAGGLHARDRGATAGAATPSAPARRAATRKDP
jgi:hypothetical protein